MLSNPLLTERGIDKLIRLETLVIDEASQISVGFYMVLLLFILRNVTAVKHVLSIPLTVIFPR